MQRTTRKLIFAVVASLACVGLVALSRGVVATDSSEFSLQVAPSPLVLTLTPGQTTTQELKIRSNGPRPEALTIEPRRFAVDDTTGNLTFDDTKKPEVASWLDFKTPTFTVQPGQWYTEKVTFTVPQDAGFSYAFAFVISRQHDPRPESGRQLKGSVAIFSLITIDRPGAKRELQVKAFKTNQSVYEYLPAQLTIELKNTGNTIVQPTGNVFVQRGPDDKVPISVLPVNKNDGYILPGSSRKLLVAWDDGFQVVRSGSDGAGRQLTWNWSNLSHLRLGQYTAKLVGIYNDGQRDVPFVGEVQFWVIPWKLLLGALIVVLLVIVGLVTLLKRAARLPRKKKHIRF